MCRGLSIIIIIYKYIRQNSNKLELEVNFNSTLEADVVEGIGEVIHAILIHTAITSLPSMQHAVGVLRPIFC